MTKNGIVYIATNYTNYLEMAVKSAKAQSTNLPIIILTNLIKSGSFDGLIFKSIEDETIPISWEHEFISRYLKTILPKLSPFDRTLYIDCDIWPFKSVDSIWANNSIAMALAYYQTIGGCDHISADEKKMTISKLGSNFPQYNSGVILFDKNSVDLFDQWSNEWLIYQKHDQLALARAIGVNHSVNLLSQNYNEHCTRIKPETVLCHYSGSIHKKSYLSLPTK